MDTLNDESGAVNRRGVVCEVHDLHYNPELTEGCVLCQRESRKRTAGRRLRGGLLVVGALALVWLAWHSVRETARGGGSPLSLPAAASDASASQPLVAPVLKLDPESYKETLQRIEEGLYQRPAPSLAELRQTAEAARRLSDQVQKRENPLLAGPATLRLLAWSGDSLEPDAGYAPPDLRRARAGWEALRNDVFRPAPWFQTAEPASMEDSPPPAEAAEASPDAQTITSLKSVAIDVYHLIRTGRPESRGLGEVAVAAGDRDSRLRWSEWRRDWLRRVQRAAAKLPNRPQESSNPNVRLAYQKLASALRYLSLVPISSYEDGVPFLEERNARFQAAQREAEEGERFLAIVSR